MVTGRVHRMTELSAVCSGATLEQARAELNTAYGSMGPEVDVMSR